jgi:hypothetical protein
MRTVSRISATAGDFGRRGLTPQKLAPVEPPEGGLGFDPSLGMPGDPPPIKPATLPELKQALADDFARRDDGDAEL